VGRLAEPGLTHLLRAVTPAAVSLGTGLPLPAGPTPHHPPTDRPHSDDLGTRTANYEYRLEVTVLFMKINFHSVPYNGRITRRLGGCL